MGENKVSKFSKQVIGCCLEVHRELGPGLLESAYEKCLSHELTKQKINFKTQVALPVHYKAMSLECGYRLDFIIENELILELKSVDKLNPIHEAQVITYLKISKFHHALLINFNEILLKNGIKSFLH